PTGRAACRWPACPRRPPRVGDLILRPPLRPRWWPGSPCCGSYLPPRPRWSCRHARAATLLLPQSHGVGVRRREAARSRNTRPTPRTTPPRTESITRVLTYGGPLELLDIPGRWGKIDAFGRGLVDVANPR